MKLTLIAGILIGLTVIVTVVFVSLLFVVKGYTWAIIVLSLCIGLLIICILMVAAVSVHLTRDVGSSNIESQDSEVGMSPPLPNLGETS